MRANNHTTGDRQVAKKRYGCNYFFHEPGVKVLSNYERS
jgi:hypothetical protein